VIDMTQYKIKKVWNGKQPKRDPENEHLEDLIYILYKQDKLECYFESVRLVHGFLRNNHARVEEVHYHRKQPIAVKGYLPLGCLRIKAKERKNAKQVI